MKSQELLQKYSQGQRDFSEVDLRGQSFCQQNLLGISLNKADLRGTNFSQANLSNALLKEVRIGSDPSSRFLWIILLFFFYPLLAFLTFFVAIFHGFISSDILWLRQLIYIFGEAFILPLVFWRLIISSKIYRDLMIFILVIISWSGLISWLLTGQISFSLTMTLIMSFNNFLTLLALFMLIFCSNIVKIINIKYLLLFYYILYISGCLILTQSWLVASWWTVVIAILVVVVSLTITRNKSSRIWLNKLELYVPILKPTNFYQTNLNQTDLSNSLIELGDFRQANLQGTLWDNTRIKNLLK